MASFVCRPVVALPYIMRLHARAGHAWRQDTWRHSIHITAQKAWPLGVVAAVVKLAVAGVAVVVDVVVDGV